MVFSSSSFIFLFLPLAVLAYYVASNKAKNAVLLISSIVFYAYALNYYAVVILCAYIAVTWISGLCMNYFFERRPSTAKLLLVCTIGIDVIVLFYYKLSPLIANVIGEQGVPLAMPLGISFFCFSAISYTCDVYCKRISAERNVIDVGAYIAFFGKLLMGPIARYSDLAPNLKAPTNTLAQFGDGIRRFMIGLAKKMLLSNNLAVVAGIAFSDAAPSVALSWLGVICFSLQLYFDFSGYTDMAIGVGKMFGFNMPENFNYPFAAKSITDYWRRWHITLSAWFRDYIYIPLGGSRTKSKLRHIFNLFVVWILTGLWHGTTLSFILWGMWFFVLIVIEKFIVRPEKFEHNLSRAIYRVFTLLCVIISMVLFNASSAQYAGNYLLSMFGLSGSTLLCDTAVRYFMSYGVLIAISIIIATPLLRYIKGKLPTRFCAVLRYVMPFIYAAFFLAAIADVVNGTYSPFIYFNF